MDTYAARPTVEWSSPSGRDPAYEALLPLTYSICIRSRCPLLNVRSAENRPI